jgi:magnesium chelatase family protein
LGGGGRCNGRMRPREIRQHCALGSQSAALLQSAVQSLNLSARAYDRILKVARTVADLEEAARIEAPHLQEAISYRTLDREVWK